ncbi:MAG: histidine kinase [Saprospiraceae bacterium]|nr:histidine kinase [Saprospiraceae bacterium]
MKRSTAQCLGFDDRPLRLIGIPVVAALVPALFFTKLPFDLPLYVHSLVYTIIIWEGSRFFFIKATRYYPGIDQWRRRLALIVVLCVAYVTLSCPVVSVLLAAALPESWQRIDGPDKFVAVGASYVVLISVGAMYESMRFFTLWKDTLMEKEQVERAHLAGQLEGLRNQVNPHFLFNSLNTLIYLIPDEPDRAVRFVQQLSKVYRYVLESRDAQLIALRDELAFLDAYIFLLRERFGDNLRVELRTESLPPDTAIVPLTLQILFENAIKHNIISGDKPLTLEVFPENGHLVVRNNLQRKKQVMDSTGVGLENIRLRYKMLTGREVVVIPSAAYFTVALPVTSLNIAEHANTPH